MNRIRVRLPWMLSMAVALMVVLFGMGNAQAQTDPLPSWNSGPAKQATASFANNTTDKSSPQ